MIFLRALCFLFIISFPLRVFAQTDASRDSLKNAGVMRPIDLIKEDARWNTSSTDLFTYWLDSGLYGYYGPQPKMLIDGIPVDVNFFGWQNINMLPLQMDAIKQTSSRFTPQVSNNTLAHAGSVNFQTARPDTGLSVISSFYIGNESGDPGPYIFDSLKTTPNIDRWGPDGSISLAYRNNNWYAKGLFSFRNHQQTDLISNQRIHLTASALGTNQEYVNYKIQTTAKSGLLETGYQGQNWQIKARSIYGEDKDYLFLQPFGREIPTQSTYRQLAIDGNYRTGNWTFEGRYIAHNKQLDKRYALHTYIFDWNQTSHTISASAGYHTKKLNLKPGIIYERLKTDAPGINQPFNDLTTFYLDGGLALGKIADFNFHANVDYDEEQYAKTLRVDIPIKPTRSWTFKPLFFYSEVLPLRQNSFSYWAGQGYTFADELGISVSRPFEPVKNELTGFKLTNTFILSDAISLQLGQQLIHHDVLNVPWQIVEENEFLDTLPGQFTATREEGTRFSFNAKMDYTITDYLGQSLGVHLRNTLSGSKRYKEYYKQIPQTQISYRLDVRPVPNLNLSFRTVYRSSTEWLEFQALEGKKYRLPSGIPIRPVTGTFHTRTPAFTNVSLGIQKWFWNRHINTRFSVQNLLNQEVRTHTLGAELYTKFNIKLGMSF